jgi:ABC-2 type transport system permease protein
MNLFEMRLRGVINSTKRYPMRYVVGLAFLALVCWGILALVRRGVDFLYTYPAVGNVADAIMQRSLEALFVVLTLGVAFSVLTTAITTLYSSIDLPFLLSLPLKPVRVFYLKVTETYLSAAALPALFTVPILVGIGLERDATFSFYLISILAILTLYGFPVAIGSFIALLLMRIAPAGKVKEVATGLSVVFAAALILGLRVLRPEQLTALTPEEFDRLLQQFASFEISWLPTSWAAKAVWGALSGQLAPGLYALAALSLLLLFFVARLAAFAYREGWIRSLDSGSPRLDPTPRKASLWERFMYHFGRGSSVLVKDTRLLLRDPSQWSQLLVLVALAGVYLVSMNSFDVELQQFKDAVGTMNLAFLAFMLSGVGIRMAYPMVSLEGEGFWLLRTSNLSSRQIVLIKFWHVLPIMLVMGIGLGIATAIMIDVSPTLAWAAPIAGLSAALVITGLGVGLGAAFPRFDANNPAEIPLSPGGLLYMTFSLMFAGVMTVLLAYPAWFSLGSPTNVFGIRPTEVILWLQPQGLRFLALVVAVTALATALPLWFGSWRLSRYEPGD